MSAKTLGRLRCAVLSCLLVGAGTAGAQCPPLVVLPDELWTRLQDRSEASCFRDQVQAAKQQVLAVDEAGTVKPKSLLAAWDRITASLSAAAESGPDGLRPAATAVQDRAEQAAAAIRQRTGRYEFAGRTAWLVQWSQGNLAPLERDGGGMLQDAVDLEMPLTAACQSEAAGAGNCPAVTAFAEALIQAIALGAETGAAAGAPVIRALAAEVARIDAEWDRFLLQGKPMYWLDLVVTDRFARYEETTGGFRRPPDFQVFFLHPAPAFTIVDGAPDGQQLNPSVYIEIVGLNRWRSEALSGLSLIAAFSDNASTADLGWGALLTWNSKYSLGLVRHGSDTALTISLDLAEAYREKLRPQLERIKLPR